MGEIPAQQQDRQPGLESEMTPRPEFRRPEYKGSGKLDDKVALITGGDSGIGRAVAVHFAREGADVAIVYLNEHEDAGETQKQVEREGKRCVVLAGDVGDEAFCREAVEKVVAEFGKLDVLVNNAAEQHPQKSLEDVTAEQLERTFRTNIFGMFFMTKAALKHLPEGSAIVNSCSVTAFRGSGSLLDYAATKGAIVAFTRSLAQNLAEKRFVSTRLRPVLSGRRSFLQHSLPKKSKVSGKTSCSSGLDNPRRSRRAMYFWRLPTDRFLQVKPCTPTGATSLAVRGGLKCRTKI